MFTAEEDMCWPRSRVQRWRGKAGLWSERTQKGQGQCAYSGEAVIACAGRHAGHVGRETGAAAAVCEGSPQIESSLSPHI